MAIRTTDPVVVAGHTFDLLTDRCVNSKSQSDGGVCGMHRIHDVHLATQADIGKSGFSCVPTLNTMEYEQIQRDKARVQANKDRAYDEVFALLESRPSDAASSA